MTRLGVAGSALIVVATVAWVMAPAEYDAKPEAFSTPKVDEPDRLEPAEAMKWREDALRRAKVWWPVDPSRVDLAGNPDDPEGKLLAPMVTCRYLAGPPPGTTPKFFCSLPDGEVVMVKYGSTAEVRADVAGTRLLTALGFGADHVFVVPRVRCYGCPRFPFESMWLLEHFSARTLLSDRLSYSRYTDFEWAAVERRFHGKGIEAGDVEGWAWYELDRVDPQEGASRAELDALRLVAELLVHWDNKSSNQRLACAVPRETSGRCPQPVAIIHDLGASFGPHKVDLRRWGSTPVFSDAGRCRLSMKPMPYAGGTFQDVEITEDGRALLARQLEALDHDQIVSLFTGARFDDPQAWARAFEERVRQIEEAAPCPSNRQHAAFKRSGWNA